MAEHLTPGPGFVPLGTPCCAFEKDTFTTQSTG